MPCRRRNWLRLTNQKARRSDLLARYLPKGVKVILLADRGFVHTDAMSVVRCLGWQYRIRIKGNTWLWRSTGGWIQPQALHLASGEVHCFHKVKLHQQQWYGPVHVILGRKNLNGERWVRVSDEPTTLQTLREYALRFDIEELFKDEQSRGWNLQKSELRSLCVLSRLCSFWRWRPFMSRPKGVLSLRKGSADGLIPTGFAATAISALAGIGFRRRYSRDGGSSSTCSSTPIKTRNRLWLLANSTKNAHIDWSFKFSPPSASRTKLLSVNQGGNSPGMSRHFTP